MEIGDEHLDNMIIVAWGNDNLRAAMKHFQPARVHPICQRLQGLDSCSKFNTIHYSLFTFIRFPLSHVKLLFGELVNQSAHVQQPDVVMRVGRVIVMRRLIVGFQHLLQRLVAEESCIEPLAVRVVRLGHLQVFSGNLQPASYNVFFGHNTPVLYVIFAKID